MNAGPLGLRCGTHIASLLLHPFGQNTSCGQAQSQEWRNYTPPFGGKDWNVTLPRTRIRGGEDNFFLTDHSRAQSINNTYVPLPHYVYYFFNLKNDFCQAVMFCAFDD